MCMALPGPTLKRGFLISGGVHLPLNAMFLMSGGDQGPHPTCRRTQGDGPRLSMAPWPVSSSTTLPTSARLAFLHLGLGMCGGCHSPSSSSSHSAGLRAAAGCGSAGGARSSVEEQRSHREVAAAAVHLWALTWVGDGGGLVVQPPPGLLGPWVGDLLPVVVVGGLDGAFVRNPARV